jgi:sterol desaturase/sphingolipid hydroxylase (fatty acid hydroxylase superfamily)
MYVPFVAAGIALSILERLPAIRFRRSPLWRPFFASDVWYLLTGFVAGTSLATAYVIAGSRLVGALGVPRLAALDLPLWAAAPMALVALDLGNYVAHWLLHRLDVLWEIHKVHHSSATLDWLATFRSHLLEQALRRLVAPLALIVGGLPIEATLVAAGVFNAWAMLVHSNLRLNLRLLEPVLVTPRLHRIHHDPATSQRNFGTFLTLWDRLLRDQFVRADVPPDVVFGVPGELATYPQGWTCQLAEPLRRMVRREGATAAVGGRRAPAEAARAGDVFPPVREHVEQGIALASPWTPRTNPVGSSASTSRCR